jgi:hypothetical protein
VALVVVAFGALLVWRVAPWLVVAFLTLAAQAAQWLMRS